MTAETRPADAAPAARIPLPPLLLGLAGLIPFAALALGAAGGLAFAGIAPGFARAALGTYGAVILSFLGGVRWGLALRPAPGESPVAGFAVAVLPSLTGWSALALAAPLDLYALAAAHAALGYLDARAAAASAMPRWYGRLRLILAAGAAGCLALGALLHRVA